MNMFDAVWFQWVLLPVLIHQLLINITNVIHYAAYAAGLGIIFLVDKRKNLDHITGIIKQYNPNAVYTVEDVRFVSEETGPAIPVPVTIRYRKNRKGK
jgi:formylmethanofuran dehydrogenase subunit B